MLSDFLVIAGPSPVLYLVDERVDFVSVRCSNTLRQLAVEELVKPQTLLIVSNVLHHQASTPIPALYAGEFTVFKTSSSEPHIQERIGQLQSLDQVLLCAVGKRYEMQSLLYSIILPLKYFLNLGFSIVCFRAQSAFSRLLRKSCVP